MPLIRTAVFRAEAMNWGEVSSMAPDWRENHVGKLGRPGAALHQWVTMSAGKAFRREA